MGSYSPAMIYFLDRLSGYSSNYFKLMPSGSDSAAANAITRIPLPSNCLLDLRKFKLNFRASTTGTGARLPGDLSALIERIEISCGGISISQGTNMYNTLVAAKAALLGSKCDPVTGHPEMVRDNKFDSSDLLTATGANEIYTEGVPHCIDHFEGFLSTAEPRVLDVSLLADLVVSIHWAPTTVLSSCKKADTHANFKEVPTSGAVASYTIQGIYASVETIGLSDSVYDNMLAATIAQKGYLEVPFKNYVSFQNTHTGSSRFSIACQSLDRLWLCWRKSDYNTLGAPQPVPGYSTAAGKASSALVPADLSAYGGKFGTGGKEKYITKHQKFEMPCSTLKKKAAMTTQVSLNGTFFPQWPANTTDMYQITKSSLETPIRSDLTLEQLQNTNFVQVIRLNQEGSEKTRTLSGLDSRGVNLQGYINTVGEDVVNPSLTIFAEMTSSLRIGANRAIELIH